MTSANVTIEVLLTGDISRIRELNRLFAQAFDDADTYLAAPPDDDYLRETLAKPHVVAIVAIADGIVVGGLVAYQLDKIERRRSEFYIYDLAVAEDWRRRGIATGLIAKLQTIASARGAWVIYVQADYGDDPAIALYEKLGAREDVMHFDIAPSATQGP
jgi:aminoglycoside 3-N-acetyltransferase I